MRVLLLAGILLFAGAAGAATTLTETYSWFATRSLVIVGPPQVDCDDNLGGACFPNLATNGRATIRIDANADNADNIPLMIWARDANGGELTGDLVCLRNHGSHGFFYNTGAAEIVVGVGPWIRAVGFCTLPDGFGGTSGSISATFH